MEQQNNQQPGKDEIKAWLVTHLAEMLGIEPDRIDPQASFSSYGLSSSEAVLMSGDLEDWLGRRLSPTLAWEYPDIDKLAQYLANGEKPAQALPAPALKPNGTAAGANGPVAIIGLGCRFPGADSPQALWELLTAGGDAIRTVPGDRWDDERFYDPDPAAPGKANTRWGGFLDRVDEFDAQFFNISPREAARMDPQQRILLEVAWEALEDAGLPAERLAGSATGVFIGISGNEYSQIQMGTPEMIDAYAGTGNALSIAANRISYMFDFHGPSIALDSACSSSLVAIHLACNSLRNGEATLALAGGANLILSPTLAINFTKAGAMAPDGRCKTFDASADGYVRAEGAGLVVLKPLAAALADGDPIYAVIRGSAVNQDGRTNGLMAPNPHAQEAVLRQAYQQAGVQPGEVQYVEAHGTGTLLGDPIEANALGAVLSTGRRPDRPCRIGSVKTNLGHMEAAAGVAGVIKVALALKHRTLPASLHYREPNPHISFEKLGLVVQDSLTPWPNGHSPALAGVSSFGFGGTNAHLVLGAAPLRTARPLNGEPGSNGAERAHLLPLSARSPQALKALAGRFQAFLNGEAALEAVCASASLRRAHHGQRLAVVGRTAEEMAARLQAFVEGQAAPGVVTGQPVADCAAKLVFVFSGQGSQWAGMGRELLAQEPAFQDVIERCDQAFRPYVDWSLLEVLSDEANAARLEEIDVIQPALFAVQVGLAAVWQAWGVAPAAVVGHSMGEVAAAYVAGALTLEDAAAIICRRSQLMKRTSGQGAMLVVGLSLAEARDALLNYNGHISIAVSNSPTSTVLSGDPAVLEQIGAELQGRNVLCRPVKVDVAAHSPQMEPLRPELEAALANLQPMPAAMAIYSTVTGEKIAGETLEARYWGRNLRQPVLFADTIQRLYADGYRLFVEVSPHPVLTTPIQQGLQQAGKEGHVLGSVRRGEAEREALLASLGSLYGLGYPVDWSGLYPGGAPFVRLPGYPWQRQRYWLESSGKTNRGQSDPNAHPLLGRAIRLAEGAGRMVWENELDRELIPYLYDHHIQGAAVLPASVFLEMALAAAAELFGGEPAVEQVEFLRALFLPAERRRQVQVAFGPASGGGETGFGIYSRPAESEADWVLHARGVIGAQTGVDGGLGVVPAEIQARCGESYPAPAYYAELEKQGITYGPNYRRIEQAWRGEGEALAAVRGASAGEVQRYRMHPAVLDTLFQVMAAALPAEVAAAGEAYMPSGVEQVQVYGRPQGSLCGYARLQPGQELTSGTLTGDVWLIDEAGQLAAMCRGLRFQRLGEGSGEAQADVTDWLYGIEWQAAGPVEGQSAAGQWVIFADRGGAGEALAGRLEALGGSCLVVSRGESFGRRNGRQVSVRPGSAEDLDRVFGLLPGGAAPQGVAYLWGLDLPAGEALDAAGLQAGQALAAESLLHLVQKLNRAGWRQPPRLWVVTEGAQGVAGGASAPLGGLLWGLGQAVSQEHQNLWGGLVDLEPGTPAGEAAGFLCAELLGGGKEDRVAVRGGQRWAPRLVRGVTVNQRGLSSVRRTASKPDGTVSIGSGVSTGSTRGEGGGVSTSSTRVGGGGRFRTDGSYLITGGLGDLGLQVAGWMAAQGARRLILLGRSRLPGRREWGQIDPASRAGQQVAAIRGLEAQGVSVHLAAVDVSDRAQLAAFLEEYRREGWPPVRGVVHAAGQAHAQALDGLTYAQFAADLQPKVQGAWLLHELTLDLPLDFFVLFSSATALLGVFAQGLAGYAAGNAFMDSLAHYRQACGLPGLSINWGTWSQVGMAARENMAERLAPLGVGTIPPELGLEALGRLMQPGAAQAAVLPVDWRQFSRFAPAEEGAGLLADVYAGLETETGGTGSGELSVRDELLAAPAEERAARMEAYLQGRVGRILQKEDQTIPTQQNLMGLGFDSIMVMELVRLLERELQLRLYPREVLERPTIAALAGYLAGELAGAAAKAAAAGQAAPTEQAAGSNSVEKNAVAAWAQSLQPEGELEVVAKRNPSMVFLLSAPRSGSTLLRVMLAGHPDLFCPPELHLLPFRSMQQRREQLGATYLGEGLQRAFMELMGLDGEESNAWVEDMEQQDLSIQQTYYRLQELAGSRRLVDKSPSYAANLQTLQRAEALFEAPKYIFLVRHPYAMVESSVRMRLDKLFGVEDMDPHRLAEQVWTTMNGNTLKFLEAVDPERYLILHYEDLVSNPVEAGQALCNFLGVPYDEALLKPYSGERMTDGLHNASLGIGDPNLLKHKEIEAHLGEVWKGIRLPVRLGAEAQAVAGRLQYALPAEAEEQAASGNGKLATDSSRAATGSALSVTDSAPPAKALAPKGDHPALVLIQPEGTKRPFFFVHPASGIIYTYYELARLLGNERPFYAIQDPSLTGVREPYRNLSQYAAEYIAAMRSVQPEGPYFFGGWSFGGTVSVEMARQLHEAGQEVGLLVVVDSESPLGDRKLSLKRRLVYYKDRVVEYAGLIPGFGMIFRDALYLLTATAKLGRERPDQKFSRRELLSWAWTDGLRRGLERKAGIAQVLSKDPSLLHVQLPTRSVRRGLYIFRCQLEAIDKFQPRSFPGKMHLLRANQQIVRKFHRDALLGWGDFVGEIEVHPVPGNHMVLFQEPYINTTAEAIQACLDIAEAEHGEYRPE